MLRSSKRKLISISVDTGKYADFILRILEHGLSRKSTYICIANVHMLIEAYRDREFADVVNKADLVTPDGVPLARSLQILYGNKQPRIAGMDLLPDLLRLSEEKKLKVFFYGGTHNIIESTYNYCKQNFPTLKIAGCISPPFRELTDDERSTHISLINESGAHFVFVALGCPKQEKWMASMKGRINSCMIGIGGALPVLIGHKKRAPAWMQSNGMEWFYRFLQEPKRLFRRYATTNSLFIYLLLKEFVNKNNNSKVNERKDPF